ncbi:chromate transporter [Mesomycoplasma dispar]|uniref:Chromate transporter n=2 Tax=Mesomycoplasma dispar TaxID=86660 RepID=A0AAJ5TBZ9_9BACT|nr:chromate transporter [Mesomycoplasma dispar]AJR12056.1 chromate transporter [Mesomycoplasma dispar]VEU61398.1 chromate transporter [Mesomycoplasma dispar]
MNTNSNKSVKIKDFLYFLWFTMKISLISFGGGNSLMPIIFSYAVTKKQWISKKDFDEGLILTNLLPGPSVVQMLSLIGIKRLGVIRGVLATILGILPHLLLFLALIYALKFLPKRYLIVLNLAIFSTIIGILLGFSYIYWKNDRKSLNSAIYFTILLFSFIYSFFVPSPYNLALVPIFAVIFIYSVWFFIKKRKKKHDITN